MFSKIGNWFRNFMMGRYGSDQLNLALLGLGIVMMVLGALLGMWFRWAQVLNFLCYVPLVWCLFRVYSRNIAARRRENQAFLGFFQRFRTGSIGIFTAPSAARWSACPGATERSTSAVPGAANGLLKTRDGTSENAAADCRSAAAF